MNLYPWAIKWGVSVAALQDLDRELNLDGAGTMPAAIPGISEAAAQAAVRLEASRLGLRLWRNNVGGDPNSGLRWGLANDSKGINEVIKSGDLIGIRPVRITPQHVGQVVGQFVSREIKEPGWRYTGTKREEAQKRWALLVASMGGDAAFATGEGTL